MNDGVECYVQHNVWRYLAGTKECKERDQMGKKDEMMKRSMVGEWNDTHVKIRKSP